MSFTGFLFVKMAGKADAKRDATLREPENVTAVRDLNYAGNQDVYNTLDVYFPKDVTGPFPVIVSIHGGGYVYGTKEIYKFYGMFLAQQGFAFVNFNYHLAPKAKFPTPLRETNLVMQWMVAHAQEYHMDLDHVFMVGDSAGAQLLSQYAAIYSNPEYAGLFDFTIPKEITIRAIALNCGMYDFSAEIEGTMAKMSKGLYRDYFGKDPEAFGPMVDVLSHITGAYPPSYIMTASHDFLRANAEPMYELLKSKGIDTEWKCYGTEEQQYMAHVCHVNMNLEEAKQINRDECDFFRRHM